MNTRISIYILLLIAALSFCGCFSYNFDKEPPPPDADVRSLFPAEIGGAAPVITEINNMGFKSDYGATGTIFIYKFANADEMHAAVAGPGKFGINSSLFTDGRVVTWSKSTTGGRIRATFKTTSNEFGAFWTSGLYAFALVAGSKEKRDALARAFSYISMKE